MFENTIEQADGIVDAYVARKKREGCDCPSCRLSRAGWEAYDREWAELEELRRAQESDAAQGPLGRFTRAA